MWPFFSNCVNQSTKSTNVQNGGFKCEYCRVIDIIAKNGFSTRKSLSEDLRKSTEENPQKS